MTEPASPSAPEGDDLTAAEYVLGVLDLADRLAFEARLKREPRLSALVQTWENQFADMNEDVAPVPAPNMMPNIEARLFPKSVVKRRILLWLGLLGGTVAAGFASAVIYAFLFLAQPDQPDLVATLAGENQPLVFAASYDRDTDTLRIERTVGDAAASGNDYQLWLIGPSGTPESLGLLDAPLVTTTLADLPEGVTLAVSLEPAGGSPTGQPIGPVLVTGLVSEV